jgi:serine protease Do
MSAELAQKSGLTGPEGVYIASIYAQENNKSPAGAAGMQAGDVLLKWNETRVNSPGELRQLVEKTTIGSKAKVVVRRNGSEMPLEVIVGRRPPNLPIES